jgi:hypothetical protein
MTLLAYRLHALEDAAQRGALFADLIHTGRGIGAEDLPAFLGAVATVLDDHDTRQTVYEAVLAELSLTLACLDVLDPGTSAQVANLSDLLVAAKEAL